MFFVSKKTYNAKIQEIENRLVKLNERLSKAERPIDQLKDECDKLMDGAFAELKETLNEYLKTHITNTLETLLSDVSDIKQKLIEPAETKPEVPVEQTSEPVTGLEALARPKRRRGRPRKNPINLENSPKAPKTKRTRQTKAKTKAKEA